MTIARSTGGGIFEQMGFAIALPICVKRARAPTPFGFSQAKTSPPGVRLGPHRPIHGRAHQ